MKLPQFITQNLTLKITSANALVVSIRLLVSVFVQRIVSGVVGEAGYAIIAQIRNVLIMLTSTTTLGAFNGVVKYVSEFKTQKRQLTSFFSTVIVFTSIGVIVSSITLWFGAQYWSVQIFDTSAYNYIFKLLAIVAPFIAISRVLNGVVNGLSDYKKYTKIELISYLIGALLSVISVQYYGLKGVVIVICSIPVINCIVLVSVFYKVLLKVLDFKALRISILFKNKLLAFTVMSLLSSFCIPLIENDIIGTIQNTIGENQAGQWVAVSFISKNYMVFSSGLFTLYVLPKLASIHSKLAFTNEIKHIYKTILPIFALGMLLVYLFKSVILGIVFPKFNAVAITPLFKWQLIGDFFRLCAMVISYQFLAKKLVKSYVFTEVFSLGLFYILSQILIPHYGTEGVVMAHCIRYILYFVLVIGVIRYYFTTKTFKNSVNENL